jgi:hypothetical protein
MWYRKKPLIVEAIQLREDTIDECIAFCEGRIKTHFMIGIVIETLEGNMTADEGDWIIREPITTTGRHFYPVKNVIFRKTYEPMLSNQGGMMKRSEAYEELERRGDYALEKARQSALASIVETTSKESVHYREDTFLQEGKLEAYRDAAQLVNQISDLG